MTALENMVASGKASGGVKFCPIMSMMKSVNDFSSLAEKRQMAS